MILWVKKVSLSVAQRSKIVTLPDERYSRKQLSEKCKVCRKAVQTAIINFKLNGIFVDQKRFKLVMDLGCGKRAAASSSPFLWNKRTPFPDMSNMLSQPFNSQPFKIVVISKKGFYRELGQLAEPS